MIKVLVTGSTGMLGKAIIEALKRNKKYKITKLNTSNCDLKNFTKTNNFFKKIKPDQVIHTAGVVYGIGGNSSNQWKSIYENSLINLNVVNSSINNKVKKINFISTGAIYDSNLDSPLKEKDIFKGMPHDSEYGYAYSKRFMYNLLKVAKKNYDIDFSYIVSCNLYGENDNFSIIKGHVIPSLIHKFFVAKKNDQNVEIWGNGKSARDFMYVKEAARAIVLISEKFNGVINLGSKEIYKISEIVYFLSKISKVKKFYYNKDMPNGALVRFYELSKLKRLKFKNKVDLYNGLKKTYNWFEKNYKNCRK